MGEARSVVEESFMLIEKGDLDGYVSLLSDDCEFQAPGAELKGPQQIKAFQKVFVDAFPVVKITFNNIVESGDTVVFEVGYSGAHTGPLETPTGSIPPTGKEVNVRGCSVNKVKNGKIVSAHEYFDLMEMMGQLGVLPS